jgi:DNA-binding transcriptional regulator YhcF (GntR family)
VGNTSSFRDLGTPDWGMVGNLIEMLPEDVRLDLTRPATEVLKSITYMIWVSCHHSGRATMSAYPSRKWLARKCNRSESTVKRMLATLEATGLLTRKQRRPAAGRYSSNLYKMGNTLKSLFIKWLSQTIQQLKHRGSFLNRLDLRNKSINRKEYAASRNSNLYLSCETEIASDLMKYANKNCSICLGIGVTFTASNGTGVWTMCECAAVGQAGD